MFKKTNRGMHLTLVGTTYSISAWKIIRGRFLILKDVSRPRKLAVNILPSYVGRMAFAVLDAVMIKLGKWNVEFTGVTNVATKFRLRQGLFFKTAGNH